MHLRVNVVLVQFNVAVTDDKGNYVTGLRPEDFCITEDTRPQNPWTIFLKPIRTRNQDNIPLFSRLCCVLKPSSLPNKDTLSGCLNLA